MESITTKHIRYFMAEQTVSKKTILYYHVGLSSWPAPTICTNHIVRLNC